MKIHEILTKLTACDEAQKWAANKTWEEIYNQCHRGDWLCWLFVRTNPDDIQLLTLVKGHQANTVRHLMKDERSIAAADAAIAFGDKIGLDELKAAAAAAYAATAAADAANVAVYAAANAAAAAANATAYAANAATYAANAVAATAAAYAANAATAYVAVYAAANAAAANAAAAAAYAAAKKENQQLTANIFRKFISIDKFNI